jgi:hypothetical protein
MFERWKIKDPRELWGLSNTCPREQESSSLPKAKCFNITALVPKNYSRSSAFALWTGGQRPEAILV